MSKRSKRSKRKEIRQAGTLKSYRVFRFYHPANHPAIIVARHGKILEGYTISHTAGDEQRKSIRLLENPELLVDEAGCRRKAESSYLRLQKRTGKVGHEFSKEILPLFRLCDADERLIDKILRAKNEGLPYLTYFDDSEMARISPPQKVRKKEK